MSTVNIRVPQTRKNAFGALRKPTQMVTLNAINKFPSNQNPRLQLNTSERPYQIRQKQGKLSHRVKEKRELFGLSLCLCGSFLYCLAHACYALISLWLVFNFPKVGKVRLSWYGHTGLTEPPIFLYFLYCANHRHTSFLILNFSAISDLTNTLFKISQINSSGKSKISILTFPPSLALRRPFLPLTSYSGILIFTLFTF